MPSAASPPRSSSSSAVAPSSSTFVRGLGRRREHQPFHRGNCTRRGAAQVFEFARERRLYFVVGNHQIGHADAMCFRRIDHTRSDRNAPNGGFTQASHEKRNDLRRNEAVPRFGQPESRARARDHEIRTRGHAEAAAHTRAFDHGNNRLRQCIQALQHVAEAPVARLLRIASVRGLRRRVHHHVEIAAGAEVATRAPQHDHAQVGPAGKVIHRHTDLVHHRLVQRIAYVRAIEDEARNCAVGVDADVLESRFIHGASVHRPCWSRRWRRIR